MKTTYKDEFQFKGYSDSSRAGPCVTFRLPSRESLEAFIGCEGKRYAAVLIEIMPDETLETDKPSAAPAAGSSRQRLAPLCEWAVMRCGEPMFQEWVRKRWEDGDLSLVVDPEHVVPKTREEWAKYVLCLLCEISSRKELDTKPGAAERFHELVRKPYAKWLAEQGVTA